MTYAGENAFERRTRDSESDWCDLPQLAQEAGNPAAGSYSVEFLTIGLLRL